jgi:hypothetical protein
MVWAAVRAGLDDETVRPSAQTQKRAVLSRTRAASIASGAWSGAERDHDELLVEDLPECGSNLPPPVRPAHCTMVSVDPSMSVDAQRGGRGRARLTRWQARVGRCVRA